MRGLKPALHENCFCSSFFVSIRSTQQTQEEIIMTSAEKTSINEYRVQGFGYKKIAEALSLPLATIKSYCRRHPGADLSTTMNKSSEPMIFPSTNPSSDQQSAETERVVCRQCGKPISRLPNHRQRQFCSNACRQQWWLGHSGSTRLCPVCGRSFMTARRQTYCSHACYIKARFSSDSPSESVASTLAGTLLSTLS